MGDRAARLTLACAYSALLALLLTASGARASAALDWHLIAVGADRAWQVTTGEGVTVAVIDSGVDADHPDLAEAVLPGRSYVEAPDDGAPSLLVLGAETDRGLDRVFGHADPVGHGTAVAGIIAGRSGLGHAGVAPGASILPVRVLDDDNRYHDSAMVGAAVRWAVDNGADVVNLSLGGHYESPAFAEALDYAAAHDVLVVACTGNRLEAEPEASVWFPARSAKVLAVTGVDRNGRRWPTAVTGLETDLAAPSAHMNVASSGGGYESATGTSFAAAVVSGAAALVRSAQPHLTAEQVRHVLTATAAAGGRDLGAGIVDAASAVGADIDRLPPPRVGAHARDDTAPAWSLAATAASGSLLAASALVLRTGRRERV